MLKAEELKGQIDQTIKYLKTKQRILFLTTSNRWSGEHGGEKPKSTQLAEFIAKKVSLDFDAEAKKIVILDIPKLKIYPCEGNVSTERGNTCGLLDAMLKNPEFNPSGYHRCWASINNPDDELWKISKELFQSDCVIIFGSIRWGQMNSHYQKLIERLTWIENRHSTLGEENIVGNIDSGLIVLGHNWNGANVVVTQKETMKYFGFKTPDELFWNYQFLKDGSDESNEEYKKDADVFKNVINDLSL